MIALETSLKGVFLLEPKVFGDDRGFFFESYNEKKFLELLNLKKISFVQDNHSKSSKGVLRGLHYQIQQTQGKLIRVLQGEIFDVAVDLRKSSETFGKWYGVHLSAENKNMLWVPEGCAHGFLVLSETAEVLYKTSDFYAPQFEKSIIWNDLDLKISWPLDQIQSVTAPLLSEKDKKGSSFREAEVFK